MSNHGRFLLRAGFNALLGAGRKQQALLPVGAVVSPSSLPDSQREDSYGQKRQRDPFLTSSSKRLFHSTANREILPLVAAGAVVFIGRYSWKALNRMDEDWEDYLWELKQYERARVQAKADATITIGVDLGTFYLKLSRVNKNKPQLIETAQGDRYRFNGILSQDDDVIMGKPALEKFFYEKTDDGVENNDSGSNKVVLPYMELQNESNDDATALVQKVFVPAVAEAMERVMSDGGSDASSDEKKNLRTVLTLPPLFYNKHGDGLFRKNYHDNSHQTITVPEPVAAIWGAQALNLIPTPESKEENSTSSTMVMDIGGLASTISLVRDDKVVASVSLDGIGGENFVQQLVDRILVETGDETMGKEPMTLRMIQTNARSSALELVNKTQSKIHIPFLYMGRRPDDPHLETTISRAVLEQAVQDGWSKSIIPKMVEENMLSSSLPIPKDVTSLFTSAVTKVLEESNEIPTNIERILLVGGGSRHKLFEEACKESITALMGPANYQSKIVIPETSLRAELTALGAASLLPNFDYDYDKGLENV